MSAFSQSKFFGGVLSVGLLMATACDTDAPDKNQGSSSSASSAQANDDTDSDPTKESPTSKDDSDSNDDETGSAEEENNPSQEEGEQTEATHECDIWAQDCGDGFKCVPGERQTATDPRPLVCVPVTGDNEPGDGCVKDTTTAGDNCNATSFCLISHYDEGKGFCTEICKGSPEEPECSDGYVCLNDVAVFACVSKCDPTVQGCEEENSGCYLDGRNFVCLPTAPGGPGEAEGCLYTNHCAAGGTCIPVEAYRDPACDDDYACCIAYCDTTQEGACDDERTCVSIYYSGQLDRMPGLEHVGLCITVE